MEVTAAARKLLRPITAAFAAAQRETAITLAIEGYLKKVQMC